MVVTCWVVKSTTDSVPSARLAVTARRPSAVKATERGSLPTGISVDSLASGKVMTEIELLKVLAATKVRLSFPSASRFDDTGEAKRVSGSAYKGKGVGCG